MKRSLTPCFVSLSVVTLASGLAFAGVGTANPEVEPNETKAAATLADSGGSGMVNLDFLTGTCTGASTLPGPASVDYFRVRTAEAPAAIYRHRLVITTAGTAGHIGTIRGVLQSNGNLIGGDPAFQTSSPSTSPARFNQWYGFGRQEEIIYRISGLGSTNMPYVATLSTEQIIPTVIESGFQGGTITIARDTVGGNVNDVDMWLYDSTLTAIALAGNDGQDSLTRQLAPGTYYLAISNFNTANNLASPPDDSFRNASVLDFPNAIANTSLTANLNMGIAITDALGTTTVAGAKSGPYDIVWYQFTVVIASNPAGVGSATPSSVSRGSQTLLTVVATPGGSPDSTGLAVTVDAEEIGAGSINLSDDGTGGDMTAGDLIFSANLVVPVEAPLGEIELPFRVTDLENRMGTGTIALSINTAAPANDDCANATPLTAEQVLGEPIAGTTVNTSSSPFDATGSCGSSQDNRDVYYSLEATSTGFWSFATCSTANLDTVVSVHTDCPNIESINLVSAQSCQDGLCGPANGGARTFAFLESGVTYIARVATKDTSTGSFTLVVTPPGPAAPNDDCEGAIATDAAEIPFNNSGASTSAASFTGCTDGDPISADVWFRWSPPQVVGNGQWRVSLAGPSNLRLALGADACPPGDAVACLALNGTFTFTPPSDSSTLIQVGGTVDQPIVGDASIIFTFIPTTGMCCSSAGTLSVTSQSQCEGAGGTYQGDNTSGGLTGPGTEFPSSNSVAIPDNDPAGITDSIELIDDGTVTNLTVSLLIDHSFLGDLNVTLTNGEVSVPLFQRVGRFGAGFGSASDLLSTNSLRFYDTAAGDLWAAAASSEPIEAGDYSPTTASNARTALAGLAGLPIAGTWTLSISDNSGGNTGTLVGWSLEINPATVCPTVPTCAADFNGDTEVNPDDLADFITCFFLDIQIPGFCPAADFNGDGSRDPDDLADFITTFFVAVQFGC